MVHTKAWTEHRNRNGVPVFGWNAALVIGHVTQVLERLNHLQCSLVSLLFFVP
ncbi:hypothetical protein OS493_039755, partial [Desmophyllum pertusum]